jgi:hypothetical protein
VYLLRHVRRRHNRTLAEIEDGMELPLGTLKQIEQGYRPLPGSEEIGRWMQQWMRCVGVTEAERMQLEDMLMRMVLGQLDETLADRAENSPPRGRR